MAAALKTPQSLCPVHFHLSPSVVALEVAQHLFSLCEGRRGFLLAMPQTSLLISESPLQVLPTLAVAVGLNAAIVLQQLFYLQSGPQNGRTLPDGEKYVFNTYAEWKVYFPFWSEPTIKRVFLELEERSLVVTKQPEGPDRRKYYRIPESVLASLTKERLEEQRTKSSAQRIKLIRPTDQNDPPNGSNCSLPLLIAETTTETTQSPTVEETAEAIYRSYPRKIGRGEALRSIRKALAKSPPEKLLTATLAYAAAISRWPEGERKYVPYPATWFNRESYDDDPKTWQRTNDATHQKPASRALGDNSNLEALAEYEKRLAAQG